MEQNKRRIHCPRHWTNGSHPSIGNADLGHSPLSPENSKCLVLNAVILLSF